MAIEADWPDAARIDQYVRRLAPPDGHRWEAFSRFPTWMWRNREVLEFVEWLRAVQPGDRRSARSELPFYGLDLYSVFTSIRAVLDYLDRVDPEAARIARLRYGCLTPWEGDPALYGRLAVGGRYRVCEDEAVATLKDLLKQRLEYTQYDGVRFLDAVQNARLVANAERYYRIMYYGSNESWNHRDRHMFDTLELLLGFHGSRSEGRRLGAQLALGRRGRHGNGRRRANQRRPSLPPAISAMSAYLIGQGTDHGTVAAANNWDEPVEFMTVRAGHPGSYESLFHDSGVEAFFLPSAQAAQGRSFAKKWPSRGSSAPLASSTGRDTELASHYFHALLSHQFDEFIWFDHTKAVDPIGNDEARRLTAEHPFSLRALIRRHATRNRTRAGPARVDAPRTNLAERTAIPVDRCLRRRVAGVTARRAGG